MKRQARHVLIGLFCIMLLIPTAEAIQLDIDGNNQSDALTDGILVIRYLFGFRGTTLTNGAIGAGATRTDSSTIEPYLAGLLPTLDIDQNGIVDALTDGVLLIRYLFGFSGTTLTTDALGTGATRTSPQEIQDYMATLIGAPAFASTLATNPNTIYKNESTTVTFAIGLSSPGSIPYIEVLQTDEAGSGSTIAVKLYDDGDLAKGDDIAGDGVYHNKLVLSPTTTIDNFYRAKLPTFGIKSDVARLVISPHLTSADFTQVTSIMDIVDNLIKTDLANGKSWIKAQDDVIAYFSQQPINVPSFGLSDSGTGIWWTTKEGILGAVNQSMYILSGQAKAGGAISTRSDNIPPELRNTLILQPAFRPLVTNSGTSLQLSMAGSANSIVPDSNLALALAPYASYFEPKDEADDIGALLTNAGYAVTLHSNAAVTLEDFKNWSPYGVIVISSHGDNFYNGLFSFWQNNFGESIPGWGVGSSQVIVLTGIKVDNANKPLYEADLVAQRAVLTPGNTLAITPSFIKAYSGSMGKSLVYMSSCRSTFNDSMATAILGAGAKAYFGYSDYVGSAFAFSHGISTFKQLLGDGNAIPPVAPKNTGDVTDIGATETDSDPATYRLLGANNLSLIGGLKNGTFEAGTLAGWIREGDARIITSLGPLSPPQGVFMSIISTGLGSVQDSQSGIHQTFTIPNTASHLRFIYNVISEEPMEFVGTIFDDKVDALLTVDGSETTIMSESINTSTWFPISGIDFAGGDSTVFQTGWKSVDLDVSAYRGKSVIIEFRAYDAGDSIFDTALVLDNVRVEP
jgi:hypothetical protein